VESAEPAGDTAATSVAETVPPPPIAIAANQLLGLIDSARVVLMELPELTPGTPAAQARRIEEQWNSWSTGFLQQLEATAAVIAEPLPEDAHMYAKLGHQRVMSAIEELRQLARYEADPGVPPKYLRTRNLMVARNHIDSAGKFLANVGIYL
jgi:hypothetical protein